METAETKKEEREIYDFFRLGVLIKAGQGIIELISGVLLFFIPLTAITRLADHFTEVELAKDPADLIANTFANFLHGISIASRDFAVIYLLVNGLVKIILVVALLSGRRWAYPVALITLGGFILYLAYRIFLHHSPLLAVATLLDITVFYFIWREYLIVERKDVAK